MRIYHASLGLKTLLQYHRLYPHKKVNVLRSFGMLDNEMIGICKDHRDKVGGLIFDSGTWTLNNAATDVAARINMPNYRDYLKQFQHHFNHYFNFDSVFENDTDEINYQDQLALEAAGLNPIPVVHDVHRDEINYYVDKGYKIIALGSKQNGNQKVLEYAFDMFSRAGVKVHLFGNVKFNSIANFPVWSCDTTAWAQRGKWGSIYYWNPHRESADKTDKIYLDEYLDASKKRDFYYSNYEYRQDLDNYLYDELKITSDGLYGSDGAYYKYLANLHFYVKLEELVTQIHQAKGFITN
jgi:hypothetical protein